MKLISLKLKNLIFITVIFSIISEFKNLFNPLDVIFTHPDMKIYNIFIDFF